MVAEICCSCIVVVDVFFVVVIGFVAVIVVVVVVVVVVVEHFLEILFLYFCRNFSVSLLVVFPPLRTSTS